MSRNYEASIVRNQGKKDIPTPSYYCRDCNKRCGNRCTFFSRPIDMNFNRCFNHSFYSPIHAAFRATANLEQIVIEQQEKLRA